MNLKQKKNNNFPFYEFKKNFFFFFIGNIKNLKKKYSHNQKKYFFEKSSSQNNELKKNMAFSRKNRNFIFSSLQKTKEISKLEDLKKWLKMCNNRNFVKHRFLCFLFGIYDEKYGLNFYIEKLKKIFSFEKKNLMISFLHLAIGDPLLAIWLIDEPEEILIIFQESCIDIIKDIFHPFFEIRETIFIRIFELPILDSIKDLRLNKMNSLVKIKGVVISKTNIYPHLKFFKLLCLKCFELQKTIYTIKANKKIISATCFNCKGQGPFQINWSQSEYFSFQKIFIQESNQFESVGYFPAVKEIILKNDLIDFVKLGEEIIVTGILKYDCDSNTKYFLNSRIFFTFVEANFIEKPKSFAYNFLFDVEEEKILNLIFRKKKIMEYLLSSFIPSIYYCENLKLPILLSLFGKQNGKVGSKLWIRNTINILIMGGPGTGKTQILKGLEKVLPKSVLITGQVGIKNGLTSSLKYNKLEDEWILEGGVFVFADKGFCLIDEIEQLHPKEHLFLNKVIDYQFITIFKKKIHEYLKTRCSIIATTNPSDVIYQSELSFVKNSFLEDKFLAKFDIHLTLKNNMDYSDDEITSKLVIKSHNINHFLNLKRKHKNMQPKIFYSDYFNWKKIKVEKQISQKLFKKYVVYARECIKPVLNQSAHEFISKIYIRLRKENFPNDSIRPTLRHLESILRLTTATARLHLREKTNKEDAIKAASVFLKFFFDSQPNVFGKILKSKFKNYLYPLEFSFENLLSMLINFFLQKLKIQKSLAFFKKKKFENRLKKLGVEKKFMKKFYESKSFLKSGFKISKNKTLIFYAG